MGLVLEDLNAQTRELMLSEVEADIQAGRLYESANFDAKGRAEYPDLLREAALHGDDDALAAALNRGGVRHIGLIEVCYASPSSSP